MKTLSSFAQNIHPNPNKSSQDDLPSWIKFHLKYYRQGVNYCEGVIMDHYLIALVQDETICPDERERYKKKGYDMSGEEPASLLAFDLLDHTVQQAEIDDDDVDLFSHQDDYSFIKYGENQILQYAGWRIVCITVESLKQNHTWKLCETSGEEPYSMKWTTIEQQEKYLQGPGRDYELQFGGVFYKDHLVTLQKDSNEEDYNSFQRDRNKKKKTTLCCLNLKTKNTWVTFDINDGLARPLNGLIVYNGLLLTFGTVNGYENLTLLVLNLENFGICAPKSAEEEYKSGLFLSQNESDIAFSIEDKVIPTHKSILREKSPYFENVFDSGMAESRQDTIQIKDCEYEVFQEYLRFIYQDKVDFSGDTEKIIKLYTLADKFLQLDLQEKCLNHLTYNVNRENVSKILDFAYQKNIPHMTNWCLKIFEDNINNMAELLNYIDNHEDPYFKENNKELIEKACNFIIKKFSKLFEEKKKKKNQNKNKKKNNKNSEDIETDHFKEMVFRFVQENLEIIMTSKITGGFSKNFFRDFTLYQKKNPCKTCSKRKKRMKPVDEEIKSISTFRSTEMNNNNNNPSLLGSYSSKNNASSPYNSSQSFISSQNLHLILKKDDLPPWVQFSLKSFPKEIKYCASVIMDHYLIVLVQYGSPEDSKKQKREYYWSSDSESEDSDDEDPAASFLLFDLHDHSVRSIDTKFFAYQENYTFIKYAGIIKALYVSGLNHSNVEYKQLETLQRKLQDPTAQIYKDLLYVYGIVYDDNDLKNELWSFDLTNRTWKFCETSGEGPAIAEDLRSFILKDCLVVYGGSQLKTDLFLLDFNLMRWTKVEQQEEYLKFHNAKKNGGVLYKDNLVLLNNPLHYPNNALCCLDLKTKNTWTTFDLEHVALSSIKATNLMVYNNLLLGFGTHANETTKKNDFILWVLNLENLGICTARSAEDEKNSSLFMSQTDSDICFSIEEKLIPAHQSVLRKKSQFFLFTNGMVESKEDVIEIQDCEYNVFQEYLRFIYQDKVDFSSDTDKIIKLYALADKLLQFDLQEKCLNYLTYNINKDNVYKILDFSHQNNIPRIHWCLRFFEENSDIENMTRLLSYIEKLDDPNFKENNKGLIEKVCTLIIKKFSTVFEKENSKNMEMDETIRFKESVFHFVQENIETIMTSKISEGFSEDFFKNFTLFQAKNVCNTCQKTSNRKKRMEPVKDDNVSEENPELKKTKKFDPAYGN